LPIYDKLKIKNFNSLNLKCMQDQINKTKLFIGIVKGFPGPALTATV